MKRTCYIFRHVFFHTRVKTKSCWWSPSSHSPDCGEAGRTSQAHLCWTQSATLSLTSPTPRSRSQAPGPSAGWRWAPETRILIRMVRSSRHWLLIGRDRHISFAMWRLSCKFNAVSEYWRSCEVHSLLLNSSVTSCVLGCVPGCNCNLKWVFILFIEPQIKGGHQVYSDAIASLVSGNHSFSQNHRTQKSIMTKPKLTIGKIIYRFMVSYYLE